MIRKKVNYPAQRGIQCSACTVREAGLGVNRKECYVVSFDLKISLFKDISMHKKLQQIAAYCYTSI
jgi:hypothetical protein